MRELVARYLSQGISRRGFVGGLTKAGLTASGAQSVLSAVASVSPGHAQGAGPQPDAAPAAPAPAGRRPRRPRRPRPPSLASSRFRAPAGALLPNSSSPAE